MAYLPGRDAENLAADLRKIRVTTRMRLGVVAGVVIVGLFQTRFPDLVGLDTLTAASILAWTALPVLMLAVAGVFVVVALARRDIKRKEAEYESKRFRIPGRAARK
jgi:cytochrome c-type biogenesis protein CcmH/NrfF